MHLILLGLLLRALDGEPWEFERMFCVLMRIFLLIWDVMHVCCTLQGCGAGYDSTSTFVPGNGSVLTCIWFFCHMNSMLVYGAFADSLMHNLTSLFSIGPLRNCQIYATFGNA